MSLSVNVRDLTLEFEKVRALDGVSFDIEAGKIYGLLGRNGAGKTTLMSVMAAFRKATSGQVVVDGEEPWENLNIVPRVCLIREGGDFVSSDTCRDVLSFGNYRPSWDQAYAEQLVEKFDVDLDKRVDQLSRGQRSVLAGIFGLASRAELTMFDEVHLGMDAPTRQDFYQELLTDYIENPRTIVISSHLIDEISKYLEEVVIIHKGKLLLQDSAETLQAAGASLTGPTDKVDGFSVDLSVLSQQVLGSTKQVTVSDVLTTQQKTTAREQGIDVGPVGLQDLFIHLTSNGNSEVK